MRVGILARKSTAKQETAIERQIADARAFAAQKGWTVVESSIYFVPEGISGAAWNREAPRRPARTCPTQKAHTC